MRSSVGLLVLASALAQAGVVTKATIEQCLTSKGVPIDTRGTPDWDRDSASFNVRVPYNPVAISVPTTIAHIQNSVNCARLLGIKVNPKSGGHSYATLGFGGENGHLIVELDRMVNVSLDPTTKVAIVEPGARLGHLATELYTKYNRAISHGTCPGVGISGHFAHGGFGFSSHIHGLALDQVVGVSVVTADGKVVQASATQNADLFWAVRGAASSFGIVAEWRVATFEPPSELTKISVSLNWDQASAKTGLNALELYAKYTMPKELNFRVSTYASTSAGIEGVYYGTPDQASAVLTPLLAAIAPNANVTQLEAMNWLDLAVAYSFSDVFDMTTPSPRENFYSKSLTLKGLNGTAAQRFVDYWFTEGPKVTERFWFFQLDMHGGKHSAISALPFGSTSYAHRDKLYIIQFYDRLDNNTLPWHEPEWFPFLDNWVSNVTSVLSPADWGSYANYADSKYTRAQAQKLYHGVNLRQLQRIRAKYDPTELFYHTQSIQAIP